MPPSGSASPALATGLVNSLANYFGYAEGCTVVAKCQFMRTRHAR